MTSRRPLPPPAAPRSGTSRRRRGSHGARVAGRRVKLLRGCLLIALVALVLRLVDLQVVDAGHYQADANNELVQRIVIPALRGGIYDRNGAVLSLSVPLEQVLADDAQIAPKEVATEARALAALLQVPEGTLAAELSRRGPGSGDVVLAPSVSLPVSQRIAENAYPGITIEATSQRTAPNGSLGASVLGFLDYQGHGAAGLEYQENRLLAGRQGVDQVLKSPNGLALPQSSPVELVAPVAGRGLELTLDTPLQYAAERALGEEILSSHAMSGVAIVMDTRTGDVLAEANLVNQTLGRSTGVLSAPASLTSSHPIVPGVGEAMNDLALTQTYEPGSVFKLVTFAAALANGVITPTTPFTIPDQISFDGYTFHDAENHGLIRLSATQILAQSSNLGTFQIASRLGESALLNQVHALGFGAPTGLGLGESQGLLINADKWEPTDMVSLAIGQVDAATAQQVLDAYNTVANGGVFVAPRLVRATVGANGTLVEAPPAAEHRVLSYATAQQLTTMLEQVVLAGTGTNAVVPGYSVAGKTGTAQIPNPNSSGYLPGDYSATFVGYAPAQNPVLSAIVILNRPTPLYFGGQVAAPVFSTIMSYALHRYGIPTTAGAPTVISQVAPVAEDVTGAGVVR